MLTPQFKQGSAMGGDAQCQARKLKAAVVARLHDASTCEHQDGLMKALQLCERFINSSAASTAAYAVLKDEVAKALLYPPQAKPKTCATAGTLSAQATAAGKHTATAGTAAANQGKSQEDLLASQPPAGGQQRVSSRQGTKSSRKLGNTYEVATVLSPNLNVVPTLLLEHKAHLTQNAFDRIVKEQDRIVQEEDLQWKAEKQRRQQHLRAQLAAQLAEREAQREVERKAKLQEIKDTDAACAAAYQAQVQEKLQLRATQQRQWNVYRQQQEEAEEVRRVQAEATAREQALERADLEAAEAAKAAAAGVRVAANRAKLEAFKAEAIKELEAKSLAAAARQEQERKYTEECTRAMDAAEAKRLAVQQSWRERQKARYEQAGGLGLEKKREEDAKAAEAKTVREAAAHEARMAARAAARKAAEQAAAQQTAERLKQQMSDHEAARIAAAAQKLADAAAAALARQQLDDTIKAEKAAVRAAKQEQLEKQQQELAEWRQRKFNELNAPLAESDGWVHRRVLQGQQRAFTNLKDNKRV